MSIIQSILVAAAVGQAHDMCRIHTDSANWTAYPWRNAYSPTAAVDDFPSTQQQQQQAGGDYVTHEYGYCSGGKGPWANSSSSITTVAGCAALCTKLDCKCFDFMCNNHESANCSCPTIPPVNPAKTATRVSCVGDSITAGYLSQCGLTYPAQLQTQLGNDYLVSNFGVGGTTMLRKADAPYWNHSAFKNALNSTPDLVVIMLGTNDAKFRNWNAANGTGRNLGAGSEYADDYKTMIDMFQALPSKPTVHIMVPPPLYMDGRYGMNQTVINTLFPELVPEIAKKSNLALPVDLYSMYQKLCPVLPGTPGHAPNTTDVYCSIVGSGGKDGCHPNDVGYGLIAAAVKDAISK